jgi:undecaprenyl-diphosphatase
MTGKPFGTVDSRQGWFIIVATLPIIAIGLRAKNLISNSVAADGTEIEAPLRTLTAVSIQLVVGSILMLVADLYYAARVRRGTSGKSMEQIGAKETIGVGLFQCLALMPGMSRSGTTISGGLLLGLTRDTAARFSFLLSLPAIFAAGIYSLYKDAIKPFREGTPGLFSNSDSAINVVVATVVSGIVGYFAIAFLVGYLKRHSSLIFIIYRLIAAALLFAAVWSGWLK